MKYNGLSLMGIFIIATFLFFSPTTISAQNLDPQPEIAKNLSLSEKATPTKIEDYISKYIEVKLVSGKKVKGKLVEYKNENLVLKEGLIKKQVPMVDVVSFQIMASPGEKFKESLEETKNVLLVIGIIAARVTTLPVVFSANLIKDGEVRSLGSYILCHD